MSVVTREAELTQVSLWPLRLVAWGAGKGWTLYGFGWMFSYPAHPDGYVPFSERYGYRKARHLLGGCLTRQRGSST